MSLKVFITGGSGFLGQEIVKFLVDNGHEVLSLSRSPASAAKLQQIGSFPVNGDMHQVKQWKSALSGMDVVIHAADPMVFWAPWKFYHNSVIKPAMDLYKAACDYGVKRFIFISSDAALQGMKDLIDVDESAPYPLFINSFYGKAKMTVEKFLLSTHGTTQAVIIRPTFIWGRGGKGTEGIIAEMKSENFFWINHGKALFEAVHVRNAAYAVYLAVTFPQNLHRQVFMVTDDATYTVKEFFTQLAHRRGIIPGNKNISSLRAYTRAIAEETLSKISGYRYQPAIKRIDVAFKAMNKKYRIDKIKKILGYKPIVSRQQGFEQI